VCTFILPGSSTAVPTRHDVPLHSCTPSLEELVLLSILVIIVNSQLLLYVLYIKSTYKLNMSMDTITENQVTKLLAENFSRSVIGLKHSVDLDM